MSTTKRKRSNTRKGGKVEAEAEADAQAQATAPTASPSSSPCQLPSYWRCAMLRARATGILRIGNDPQRSRSHGPDEPIMWCVHDDDDDAQPYELVKWSIQHMVTTYPHINTIHVVWDHKNALLTLLVSMTWPHHVRSWVMDDNCEEEFMSKLNAQAHVETLVVLGLCSMSINSISNMYHLRHVKWRRNHPSFPEQLAQLHTTPLHLSHLLTLELCDDAHSLWPMLSHFSSLTTSTPGLVNSLMPIRYMLHNIQH